MSYRLAAFDFDGTLADSFAWFGTVINDAAARYHFKRIEKDEIDMLRGRSAREVMRHVGVARWKMPLIANYMRKRKAADVVRIRLFGAAAETIETLAAHGVAIAIVSSNTESNIRAILGPRLAGLVAYYECGASLFGKASRFRALLRRSRAPAAQVIAIGDELRDLEAARAAGIAFGAVAWGYTTAAALGSAKPDVMFARFDDIVGALVPQHSGAAAQ
jgi:phosphoglycolate phosphatase